MSSDFLAAWNWFSSALETAVFKLLLFPVACALFSAGKYFGRRAIEKTGENEKIKTIKELFELRQAMNEGNVSIDDLNDFRRQLLGKNVRQDVATATFYLERAEQLHGEHPDLLNAQDGPITQADMNDQAFVLLTRAENELASVILEKMAGRPAEELDLFQKAQRTWTTWKKAESEWESLVWEGGSIRPLMVAMRLEALTRERISTIKLAGDLTDGSDKLVNPYKRTPRDLPNHLAPGISGDRVRQLIGVPHYIGDDYWFYRFEDSQLQLRIEGEVITEFAFMVIENEVFEVELEGIGPLRFGSLTWRDLESSCPAIELQNRFGARTNEYFAELHLGAQSARFFFGSIITESGGKLRRAVDESEFDFSDNKKRASMRINWFGRSNSNDAPYIWWHI